MSKPDLPWSKLCRRIIT